VQWSVTLLDGSILLPPLGAVNQPDKVYPGLVTGGSWKGEPVFNVLLAGTGVPPEASNFIVTAFMTAFHLAYTSMFAVTGVFALKPVPVPSALVFQLSKV
jgi:hypothetical protein